MESGCRLSADDAVPSTCTPDEASSLSVLPIEEAIHASRTEGDIIIVCFCWHNFINVERDFTRFYTLFTG
ncbi:hypothetical protein AFLA_012127 [Aspergillus flavus NRRL3357]|nr:hypothetical protein AFLA_012127 [Aspergillus flavus NRRL3357]